MFAEENIIEEEKEEVLNKGNYEMCFFCQQELNINSKQKGE